MEINKIVKALLDACEDCSERLSCDAGVPRIYCPNRDAAARLVALNDFLNTQCAKLLSSLTDANDKIAELQEMKVSCDGEQSDETATLADKHREALALLELAVDKLKALLD